MIRRYMLLVAFVACQLAACNAVIHSGLFVKALASALSYVLVDTCIADDRSDPVAAKALLDERIARIRRGNLCHWGCRPGE